MAEPALENSNMAFDLLINTNRARATAVGSRLVRLRHANAARARRQ